jgi:hypothetical protein
MLKYDIMFLLKQKAVFPGVGNIDMNLIILASKLCIRQQLKTCSDLGVFVLSKWIVIHYSLFVFLYWTLHVLA